MLVCLHIKKESKIGSKSSLTSVKPALQSGLQGRLQLIAIALQSVALCNNWTEYIMQGKVSLGPTASVTFSNETGPEGSGIIQYRNQKTLAPFE